MICDGGSAVIKLDVFKYGPIQASFCLCSSISHYNSNWTRGHKMVGADWTMLAAPNKASLSTECFGLNGHVLAIEDIACFTFHSIGSIWRLILKRRGSNLMLITFTKMLKIAKCFDGLEHCDQKKIAKCL